jgi:hypothetical protein
VPWREIFVYSPRVEGIHLRAGPVARGGLRWSDRRDDFRTEVLGLMKAQRVKNAVIVPTGAKGGFYPKQLPDPVRAREAWLAEGRASYEVFIRTLLSANMLDDPLKVSIRRKRLKDCGSDQILSLLLFDLASLQSITWSWYLKVPYLCTFLIHVFGRRLPPRSGVRRQDS